MILQDILFSYFDSFLLPAIASRSGEAGGEETVKAKSTCGGKKLQLCLQVI